MLGTIASARTPNLLLMEYLPDLTSVRSLVGIHRHGLSALAIVKRTPLASTARRAGWVGCNIDLDMVPALVRVALISRGHARPWPELREEWGRLAFMVQLRPESLGWLRDVLACVQELPVGEFSLSDLYRFESTLGRVHPENRNVRPKIRQQLQVLVAQGLIRRARPGLYTRDR
jgi:type II restriction enzyme